MAQPLERRMKSTEAELVPLPLIRAMVAMVLASLAIASYAVWTDRPLEATPPAGPVVTARTITLEADMTGAARVMDADGRVIADLAPDEGGFVSGVARVIERERRNARLPLDAPVRLEAMDSGRIAIIDPSTGWRADLMGFGADNAAAFARLLQNEPE
ncbi:hypothetical protein ROJ8625_02934 [Roseivivax jejudonensis]|uniref:Photosynthetic complex assembly protein n=1 Tax=Roseivivax jejudonensis TaxID=1529041 RepID=A0A1X6ZQ94_9RHOB|nr:photosynthetic complex assembly protein PuhC [Roseivivax jejudonensis]SLN58175.1 hypothetical protein ROJ8625_02934 [Roseivivax jejudonensis]